MATKKKHKGKAKKKLTQQFAKHLKRFIKVHGTELVLGFLTGVVTKFIAERTGGTINPKTESQEAPVAETTAVNSINTETDKASAATTNPKPVSRKAPARKKVTKPKTEATQITDLT